MPKLSETTSQEPSGASAETTPDASPGSQYTFHDAHAFNGAVDQWDTSALTTLYHTFDGATAFDQPLASWDTSLVTDWQSAFRDAAAFNRPLAWDTSKVRYMFGMFSDARNFNQPSISAWDVAKVTWKGCPTCADPMDRMFDNTALASDEYSKCQLLPIQSMVL